MTPLAAAIFAVLNPVTSLAQEQQQEQGLEEVIVTATRRESNLQEVPQSITVFSTEDIQRQAFQNMQDYIKALPSMNLVNVMPGRNSVIMRGVSTGSAEYRTDSQVAVYLDEQPMTSISQQVDVRMIDVARIESLPG
ncbi:MAG TPA: TonB-dependent receptor plug domain-containing protein, partial [Woeseiaceae bacterium]|nr:TonB-dependent receptor plug domain-containing protein [Woeseiaceae bacterium]